MIRSSSLLLLLCALVLSAGPAAAQTSDVVTVGTVATTGTNVTVPVSIRDVSATPLGVDQPAGSRIQAYSIKVDYTPASAIASVTFQRAGITAGLTPSFESSPSTPGSISLINTFAEGTDPIPFTLDAGAPGNQVGELLVTLNPGLPAGTLITLSLDATLTQLSNQGGTTSETTSLTTLSLVDGSITVDAASVAASEVPTLAEWGVILLVLALGVVALRKI